VSACFHHDRGATGRRSDSAFLYRTDNDVARDTSSRWQSVVAPMGHMAHRQEAAHGMTWVRADDRGATDMDMKLELVAVPVADVDRAKAFYVDQVGFHADHDHQVSESLRFVQLTPPGSACSIVMGTGVTEMAPGSQKGLQVVVDDVEAVQKHLVSRNVETSEVDVQPWGSFIYFSDPDGNTWSVQQLPSGAPTPPR
jgi:catechol 2,3-dioxygenase-like lactoylglutathione lyase family enzyme